MSKTGMSAGFAKFATKTTKGKYDEARQNERIGRGIPYDVGTKGTAVVSDIICDQTRPDNEGIQHPRVRIELKIETPEAARGKALSGPGLMQTIKDGQDPSKWSKEQAWGAALGLLEDLGCPEELTKGYDDFQDVLDWFHAEPRRVSWEIEANTYKRQGQEIQGKQIRAYAYVEESSIPAADDGALPDEDGATYCMYRGGKHKIVEDHGDTVDLVSVSSGRERPEVSKDDVEMIA